MFLRLTPVVAGGRAIAALAVTMVSMMGHASLGHAHLDVSRAALGFLILLAFAWGSSRRLTLLCGALVAQAVIHGSLSFEHWQMLVLHLGAALLAGALTWHFEAWWNACRQALAPLFRIRVAVSAPIAQGPSRRLRSLWHNPFHATLFTNTASRRGPPVLAMS